MSRDKKEIRPISMNKILGMFQTTLRKKNVQNFFLSFFFDYFFIENFSIQIFLSLVHKEKTSLGGGGGLQAGLTTDAAKTFHVFSQVFSQNIFSQDNLLNMYFVSRYRQGLIYRGTCLLILKH